ncbi:MAG: helix-turn-helix domain-containing protein [Acidimicrobiales bacterium]
MTSADASWTFEQAVEQIAERQLRVLADELLDEIRRMFRAEPPLPTKAVTIETAGRMLSVSEPTVRRLVRSGHLRCVRTPDGGRVLIPISAIDDFLQEGAMT